jgi:hypothetical protein
VFRGPRNGSGVAHRIGTGVAFPTRCGRESQDTLAEWRGEGREETGIGRCVCSRT